MSITYCEGWFRYKKKPAGLMDENKARNAHERRQLYAIVLGDLTAPKCFIEINGEYIGVGFLDDQIREYLSYSFQEKQPGKLFLSMVTHRLFDGQADRVSSGTTYYFKEDGTVTIESEDFITGSKSEKIVRADVLGNWDHYPQFGQYSTISQANRPGLRKSIELGENSVSSYFGTEK